MNLADLVGEIDQARTRFGPSSILGFKGLVNLAAGIETGEIKTEMGPAQDRLDDRLIVSGDPGLFNTISLNLAVGSIKYGFYAGAFAKKVVSARSVSHAYGLKDYVNAKNQESARDDVANNLAKSHGRTMNLSDYQCHAYSFECTVDPLMRKNNSRQSRHNLARLQSRKH